MIIFMSDILCITNRSLCGDDFLVRLERIASGRCAGIILREKDLSAKESEVLAEKVLPIVRARQVPCILHSYPQAAEHLGVDAIHLPLPVLKSLSGQQRRNFRVLGASCHTVEEAREAERLGCTYITAGHIFYTDCKKGLAPRGLHFLQRVCREVSIPVWAIGGICPDNFHLVKGAGARGGCVMSALMSCEDPGALLDAFRDS